MIPGTQSIEFWRLATVVEKAGLSKSEVYRRMRDVDPEVNPFPPSHAYKNGRGGRGAARFWVSADVERWQLAEIGLAEPPHPNWPSLGAAPVPTLASDPFGVLG